MVATGGSPVIDFFFRSETKIYSILYSTTSNGNKRNNQNERSENNVYINVSTIITPRG